MLCSACFVGLQAQHIEYKWHGIYVEADYAYMLNVNRINEDDEFLTHMPNYNPYPDKVNFNGFSAVCGFQFRKEVGVGLGFNYLNDPTGAFSQIPLFIELRSHYLPSRLSPYTVIQAGYSIPMKTTNGGSSAITVKEGGVSFALLAGGRFAVTRRFGINAFVGYHILMMNKVEHNFNGVCAERTSILLHNIKFGVGLNF